MNFPTMSFSLVVQFLTASFRLNFSSGPIFAPKSTEYMVIVPLFITLSLKWFEISEIAPGLVVETNDFCGA